MDMDNIKSFVDLEKDRLRKDRARLDTSRMEIVLPKVILENGESSDRSSNKNIGNHSDNNVSRQEDAMSKNVKELLNSRSMTNEKDKCDDMEQWVSDTFYSYFPGFNNEYQKRQLILQRKQRENQENLLRHQMLNAEQYSKKKSSKYSKSKDETAAVSARSNNSSLTSNDSGTLHEGNSARVGSARSRLLQDLRHTSLSNANALNGEDVAKLNRQTAEIETARKKEYQRELMEQIEEKRRTINLLKEKEQQQEKVLTRRLQEQLQTMRLEEKLEKERLKAVKLRFDAEQNRVMREQILAKLDNDSKLVQPTDRSSAFQNDKVNKENIASRNENNKVYRYFSNSEKNEYSYRRKSFLPAEIGLAVGDDDVDLPKIERECFHLSEKICPMCDGPLKELEDFCLRCQSKISMPTKKPSITTFTKTKVPENDKIQNQSNNSEESKSTQEGESSSYYLVCVKCERFYTLCTSCLSKSDVCRACQGKRNVCMNCRRTLCTFCLEEVACGRNTEHVHINDSDKPQITNVTTNETPFQLITVNGAAETFDDNNDAVMHNVLPAKTVHLAVNNLNKDKEHVPYSINIERDSIFHPDHQITSVFAAYDINNTSNKIPISDIEHFQEDQSNSPKDNNEINIEKLRQETDFKLSRYLKNYKELAYHSRGTQTTPNTNVSRDSIGNDAYNFSIPLMREMPKMTRETTKPKKLNSTSLENLKRRWDIPAVQKYTISPGSPKVITQIGAIRKQLQTESFFSDDD